MHLKPLYSILSILLIGGLTFAQQPHPSFRNYGTDQGLPSPEVYEVLQDRRGYLWFGTDNGAARFNGYEFDNFGPARGLANNVVFYLHEDHKGRIWMITMSKNLYYYDYGQDSILAYPYNSILQQIPHHTGHEMGFYVDSLGAVYRSSSTSGFVRISPEGKYHFTEPSGALYSVQMLDVEGVKLFSYSIPDNLQDQENQLLSGVVFDDFDQHGREFGKIPISFHQLPKMTTLNFFPIQEKGYLLQFFSYLSFIQNGQFVWSGFAPDIGLAAASQMQKGDILLGSNQRGGIRKYANLDALKKSEYKTYLSDHSISHILQDKDGDFWFTSVENGVYYLKDWGLSIYDESSGLPSSNVTALAFRQADTLYFGMKDGSVFELHIPTQNWKLIPEISGSGEIFGLFWDGPRDRLFINKGGKIYTFQSGRSKKEMPYPFQNRSPGGRKFHLSYDGQTLYSNTTVGFFKLELEKGDSLIFSRERHKWSMRLFDIHEDRSGKIWAGGLNGLLEYDGDTMHQIIPHPALASRIEEIEEFSDGTLVFGTKGHGVVLWNGKQIQVIDKEQGLTSNMIERLHIDSSGNLWVGTLNGLNKISFVREASFNIQQYTTANSLPSNEVNDIQSWGDEVWLGTTRGLVKLPPGKEVEKKSRPPVIEYFTVNGVRTLPDSISGFSYQQNNLRITYLTFDYSQNGQIAYRYRLVPNEKWSLTRQRSVDYPALPPGDYSFEVQSKNKDGFWSESTVLPFKIQPPFWRRSWFWSGWLILGCGLAYIFYRGRVNRLKQEVAFQRQLAEKEREMNDLQRSALRAQMNPHFLSNCLNTIQGFIAKGDKMTAMRYLASFNRLLRRALDFSQANLISLEEDVQMLKDYLELEKVRFVERFDYCLEVEESINTFDTQIPPMLVQPFVENAIIHAFPEEIPEPELRISYRKQGQGLLITIIDNGIGITESKRRKAEGGAENRKSYGMGLPTRRIRLLNNGREEEPVVVEDLKDSNGNARGTRILIRVGQT